MFNPEFYICQINQMWQEKNICRHQDSRNVLLTRGSHGVQQQRSRKAKSRWKPQAQSKEPAQPAAARMRKEVSRAPERAATSDRSGGMVSTGKTIAGQIVERSIEEIGENCSKEEIKKQERGEGVIYYYNYGCIVYIHFKCITNGIQVNVLKSGVKSRKKLLLDWQWLLLGSRAEEWRGWGLGGRWFCCLSALFDVSPGAQVTLIKQICKNKEHRLEHFITFTPLLSAPAFLSLGFLIYL